MTIIKSLFRLLLEHVKSLYLLNSPIAAAIDLCLKIAVYVIDIALFDLPGLPIFYFFQALDFAFRTNQLRR